MATLEVDAECLVFCLQVTGAETERDATLRIQIERRARARSDERIAIRQHENAGLQPERRRRRGDERQQPERVMRMMAAAAAPATGRAGMSSDVAAGLAAARGGLRGVGDGDTP